MELDKVRDRLIELEDIISNMATQGLNTIIQNTVKEPFQEEKQNPLDGIESMDIFNNKFSEIQEVFKRVQEMSETLEGFSDIQKSVGTIEVNKNKWAPPDLDLSGVKGKLRLAKSNEICL